MILIIDNYDSFTYNLVQCVGELGFSNIVYRNDQLSLKELEKLSISKIIISPGPGKPQDAGLCLKIIEKFAPDIPILGVCLGHQSVGQVFGGKIVKTPKLMHGKTSMIFHNNEGVFTGLPNPFMATRYHSLVIDNEFIPDTLKVTAWTSDNIIMACKHKKFNHVIGIQFHPESLWTAPGKQLLWNFLTL